MSNVIFVDFKNKKRIIPGMLFDPLSGLLRTIHNAKAILHDDYVNGVLQDYLKIQEE